MCAVMNDSSLSISAKSTPADLTTPWSSHPVLDPETQQFLDLAAEAGLHPDRLLIERPTFPECRDLDDRSGDPTPVSVEHHALRTDTGTVDVHIVRPLGVQEPLPAVVYFPGGGWRMASYTTHRRLVCRLAVEAGVAVAFVAYSSAADVRYPVQNEQAYAALQYLVRNDKALRIDSRAMAVAGDGAGGNMAAVTALLARDRSGPALRLQVLICPILSANPTTRSYRQYSSGPGMTAHALEAFIDAQFPAESLSDKTAMPILARADELEDLPSALVITAENDVSRDDAEEYARNLMRAGVKVNAVRYLGTIHDFVVFDGLAETIPTDAALRHACSVIKCVLHA
ncbi:hypothetical protein WI36_05760 [Burkholderia ubonensis]|nr:hypothetical protein WI31_09330 [Burkholderia ubonensis]KUZ15612.1 hypothetical protein WI29_21080 [Burkholderia ubonensis]KUZ25375.1 hypothetical protein WI30_28765 [Burkholderia ubonensis]KUZ32192.1 hypothetical protein WI32_22830 [Burkholderia ubonensis]KUZ52298.1 hypothetical protein WI34_29875 [Burkholderia ubonensis]